MAITKNDKEDLLDLLVGKTVYSVAVKRGKQKHNISSTGYRLIRVLLELLSDEMKESLRKQLR